MLLLSSYPQELKTSIHMRTRPWIFVSSIFHSRQEAPAHWCVDQQWAVFTYNATSFSQKKEWNNWHPLQYGWTLKILCWEHILYDPFIGNVQETNLKDTESKPVVVYGLGRWEGVNIAVFRGWWNCSKNFFFRKCSKIARGDCTTQNILKTTGLHALNGWNVWYVHYIGIKLLPKYTLIAADLNRNE